MADEFSIKISILAKKGGAIFDRSESFKDDMSGDNWDGGIIDVDTTGISLAEADIASFGWVYVKNLGTSDSQYIDIQHGDNDAATVMVRLYGGESSIFKSPGKNALWADSSSGTQRLEFCIFEL